jgi:hypothetical protein
MAGGDRRDAVGRSGPATNVGEPWYGRLARGIDAEVQGDKAPALALAGLHEPGEVEDAAG